MGAGRAARANRTVRALVRNAGGKALEAARRRLMSDRERLAETHDVRWRHELVWESWKQREA
jgi:hypothetical protein